MFYRINEATLAAEMKIVDAGVRGGFICQGASTKQSRQKMDNKFSVNPARCHALGNKGDNYCPQNCQKILPVK